jgi:hypothetical protein
MKLALEHQDVVGGSLQVIQGNVVDYVRVPRSGEENGLMHRHWVHAGVPVQRHCRCIGTSLYRILYIEYI